MSGNTYSTLSEFQALRRRLLELDAQDKRSHYHHALQKAQDIAAMLKTDHGVRQVYLYGSLAWGGFDQFSDIDLCLVGFSGNYWKALSEAEALASPFEVSLACWEDCVASLQEKVIKEGVLL